MTVSHTMSLVQKIPPMVSALAFGYGVGMAAPDGPSQRSRWSQWRRDQLTLLSPLGRRPDGLWEVDLVRDGPHALVA